jgi:hypothetical protein
MPRSLQRVEHFSTSKENIVDKNSSKKHDTLIPHVEPPTTTSSPIRHPITLRSETYPTSRLSPKFEPVDQVELLKDSDRMLGAVAHGKLLVISKQIQMLKEAANKIIVEAERNMELHRVSCSFEKRQGHTYYLYEKGEGLYFSILSPEDWRGKPPHKFVGAYRLENDMTWQEVAT